jgi:hypothetical protein
MNARAYSSIVRKACRNGVAYLCGDTSDARRFLVWASNKGHEVTVMASADDLGRTPHRWAVTLTNAGDRPETGPT